LDKCPMNPSSKAMLEGEMMRYLMRRFVGWKIFVIVVLSAYGAVAPLEMAIYGVWSLLDNPRRLILYLTLAGLGLASYCLRYYKLAFASGLASAAFCLWTYWREIWFPSTQSPGLEELIPVRVGCGWLVWLAGAVFLCVVAVQEGIAYGKKPRL